MAAFLIHTTVSFLSIPLSTVQTFSEHANLILKFGLSIFSFQFSYYPLSTLRSQLLYKPLRDLHQLIRNLSNTVMPVAKPRIFSRCSNLKKCYVPLKPDILYIYAV